MTEDFTHKLNSFRKQQLENWPLAATNYAGLNKVLVKSFLVDGFEMKVQFNPERVRSTTAKVDAASIQNRACFLCSNNRPKEQAQVNIIPNYELLINPFPIFQQHFTIPHIQHTKQNIAHALPDLLDIAENITGKVVFYNGPFCGASAPDHLHFQAIDANEIPMFKWAKEVGEVIHKAKNHTLKKASNQFLNVLYFVSDKQQEVVKSLEIALQLLETKDKHDEPMLNLLCRYIDEEWHTILIPREKHRPNMFFAEGEDHFGISPASVDLGGVIVLPYLKDFERINEEIIQQVFKEVGYATEKFDDLCHRLKGKLESSLL